MSPKKPLNDQAFQGQPVKYHSYSRDDSKQYYDKKQTELNTSVCLIIILPADV